MHTRTLAEKRKTQSGFSLVEMLFVITLTTVVMVSAAGLFFTTLIGNSRSTVQTSVKNEGDYALGRLEFLIRNGIDIPAATGCSAGMTKFSIKSADETVTTITNPINTNGNKQIAIQPAGGAIQYLTSPNVDAGSLQFDCVQSAEHSTYVKISFIITKPSVDYITATPVSESFSTSVNVRSLNTL